MKSVQTTVSSVTSLILPNAIPVKGNFTAICASSTAAKLANKNMDSTNAMNRMGRAIMAVKMPTGLRPALKLALMVVLIIYVTKQTEHAYMAVNPAITGSTAL